MIGTSTKTAACGKCVFWFSQDSTEGQCRRHAPQTVAFKVDEKVEFKSTFPRTKAEDWCGDYEPR